MKEIKQLFIIGAPRSGTTYLARLLEHTDYKKPFETHFIIKYYKKLDYYGDLSNFTNFYRLLTAIKKERPILQLNLNLNAETVFKKLNCQPSYKDIVNYICLQANNSQHYWADKTPHYIENLEVIKTLFPMAMFVYIIRDGRDVGLSLLKKKWGPNNIYSCAKYWQKFNQQTPLIKELINNKQLIQIQYERLISDSDIIKSIYQFLQMQYVKPNTNFERYQPLSNNFNKWKTQLSDKDIKMFEQVAGDTLKQFNYSTAHKQQPINYVEELFYKMNDRLAHYKFLFVHNIVDGIKIKYFGKKPFAD